MKKLICVLFLATPFLIFSQESSFGFSGGYATNGFGIHASYNYELSQNDYLQTSFFFSKSNDKSSFLKIPYSTLALNIGYYYNLVKDRNSRFIGSIGGGASIGYEILNEGNTVLETGALIEGNSSLVYGALLGSELKYFLSDELALLNVMNSYIYANSHLGAVSLYIGLGVQYFIN